MENINFRNIKSESSLNEVSESKIENDLDMEELYHKLDELKNSDDPNDVSEYYSLLEKISEHEENKHAKRMSDIGIDPIAKRLDVEIDEKERDEDLNIDKEDPGKELFGRFLDNKNQTLPKPIRDLLSSKKSKIIKKKGYPPFKESNPRWFDPYK